MSRAARVLVLFSILSLIATGEALAVDGVIEINQAKIDASGGFPFTISNPGSYRLTSNLQMPGGASSIGAMISIAADDVTLDLNGFTLFGGSAGGGGTMIDGGGQSNLAVLNGSLVDAGADMFFGIDLGARSRVDAVRVVNIQGAGIVLGANCRLTNSTVDSSDTDGVTAGAFCHVSDNVIQDTPTGPGLTVGAQSTVVNNVVSGSASQNIVAGESCTLIGNTASFSESGGILAGAGSVLINNTANNSLLGGNGITCSGCTIAGNVTNDNDDAGIDAGSGGTVIGNTANGNGGAGILFSGSGAIGTAQQNTAAGNGGYGLDAGMEIPVGYSNNVFSGNSAGNVRGGTDLGGNLCGTTPGCP